MAKNGSSSRFNKVKFEIAKLNYIDLKAPESYQEAQSGQKMYENLSNMNFVINGKLINKSLIDMLYEGANHEIKEIISDKEIKEIVKNKITKGANAEMIKDACDFFEFGYSGHNKFKDNPKEFFLHAFRKTFEDAGAKIPNDHILQELITNCYQYQSFINTKVLFNSNLTAVDRQKDTIHINCNDSNCAELKVNREQGVIFTDKQDSWKDNSIPFSSSLEFKLKSNNNKEVEYTDGKLSLALTPKSTEVRQDKSLFSELVEAMRALLRKVFGKENVKEAKHEFEFHKPESIVDNPQVKNVDSKGQHIH